jgi:hypothetical protein
MNMRRILCLLLVLFVATGAFALDFATFQTSFDTFATDLAAVLPFNASTGLSWSQAYIGQFPHFGVGLTLGATTVPYASISSIVANLGVTLPSQLSYVTQYGFPIPAYTADARLGGFFLPFDFGVKVGYIPPDALQKAGLPVSADYLLVGADIRFAVLKDEGFVPALSIGAGYNYMKGKIGVPGLLGSSISIASFENPVDHSMHALSLTDPTLDLTWDTSVIEGKVQVSKRILFLTPYVGAAASYSLGSKAGGGVSSTLLYDGVAITQAQIDQINTAYAALSQTPPSLSAAGIQVQKTVAPSLAYRVYGGVSLDLFIVYLDLGAAYNISSGSLGGSVNLRLAL